ncbi:MAG: hypothetical protein ACKN9K_30770, partial [Dolichospermum sp.]
DAKQANQQLLVAQGNLKQLEIDRNKAEQQVEEFQAQKTALEQERQVILKQKQKAEFQNQKNRDELGKIEINLQVNRQKLEQSVINLQTINMLEAILQHVIKHHLTQQSNNTAHTSTWLSKKGNAPASDV